MVLTLYKMDVSPPSLAVKIVIKALDIPDVIYVDVDVVNGENKTEEYLQMNPQHTVPMIKDDDFVLWDSHAIMAYLITKYGEDDSLYPTDIRERAIVDQRLHFESGILFAALRRTIQPVVYDGEKSYPSQGLKEIEIAYEFLEKLLTNEWLAGDSFTIADISCLTTVTALNGMVPLQEDKHPNIIAWMDRCVSENSFLKEVYELGAEAILGLLNALNLE